MNCHIKSDLMAAFNYTDSSHGTNFRFLQLLPKNVILYYLVHSWVIDCRTDKIRHRVIKINTRNIKQIIFFFKYKLNTKPNKKSVLEVLIGTIYWLKYLYTDINNTQALKFNFQNYIFK